MSDALEKRISVLEANMRAVVRELLQPLQADKSAVKYDGTYGERILSRMAIIEDDINDLREDMGDVTDNILNTPDNAARQKVNPASIAASIRKYRDSTVTASVMREASNQWRVLIKMLRNKQTVGEAALILQDAGVTMYKKGKFMYFKGGL